MAPPQITCRSGDSDVDGAGVWPRRDHRDAHVELTAVAHSMHEAGQLLDIADWALFSRSYRDVTSNSTCR